MIPRPAIIQFTSAGRIGCSEPTLSRWRDLVAASGVFRPDALDTLAADPTPDKWDVRLSLISISAVIDELGLTS